MKIKSKWNNNYRASHEKRNSGKCRFIGNVRSSKSIFSHKLPKPRFWTFSKTFTKKSKIYRNKPLWANFLESSLYTIYSTTRLFRTWLSSKRIWGVTVNETTDVIVCSYETDRRSVIFLLHSEWLDTAITPIPTQFPPSTAMKKNYPTISVLFDEDIMAKSIRLRHKKIIFIFYQIPLQVWSNQERRL